MSSERVLTRHIRVLGTLQEAVGALRSLSAQHFREARAPLESVRTYRDEMRRFLGVLEGSPTTSTRPGPAGIVLVAADLGMVGDYTASLVREAMALREVTGPGPLVCLGVRALSHLAAAGVKPVAVQSAPTSVRALSGLLLPLVDTLVDLRRRGELEALWLVAARFEGAGKYVPIRVPLLPVVCPTELPPLAASRYCDAEHLRAVVVREALYASLYEALLESLASEHGKRLVTAEAARSWLEDRIASTNRLAAALRRETSTQEVLEIVVASRSARQGEERLE